MAVTSLKVRFRIRIRIRIRIRVRFRIRITVMFRVSVTVRGRVKFQHFVWSKPELSPQKLEGWTGSCLEVQIRTRRPAVTVGQSLGVKSDRVIFG